MKTTFTIRKNCAFLFCILLLLGLYSCSDENPTYKSYTVEIKQMKFQPAELVVQKGDTVIWVNHDLVAHDVTEEPANTWTSSIIPAGASWSLVATQSADYYCSLHVVMKGKLFVQ